MATRAHMFTQQNTNATTDGDEVSESSLLVSFVVALLCFDFRACVALKLIKFLTQTQQLAPVCGVIAVAFTTHLNVCACSREMSFALLQQLTKKNSKPPLLYHNYIYKGTLTASCFDIDTERRGAASGGGVRTETMGVVDAWSMQAAMYTVTVAHTQTYGKSLKFSSSSMSFVDGSILNSSASRAEICKTSGWWVGVSLGVRARQRRILSAHEAQKCGEILPTLTHKLCPCYMCEVPNTKVFSLSVYVTPLVPLFLKVGAQT